MEGQLKVVCEPVGTGCCAAPIEHDEFNASRTVWATVKRCMLYGTKQGKARVKNKKLHNYANDFPMHLNTLQKAAPSKNSRKEFDLAWQDGTKLSFEAQTERERDAWLASLAPLVGLPRRQESLPVPRHLKDAILMCLQFVQDKGTDAKGIFRVADKAKTTELARRILVEGVDSLDDSVCDAYVAGNVAKVLLRRLPETLLTIKLCEHFLNAAKTDDFEEVARLVRELPEDNRLILGKVVEVCVLVTHNQESLMNANSLSKVVGSNLLVDDRPDTLRKINKKNQSGLPLNQLFDIFINHFAVVFPDLKGQQVLFRAVCRPYVRWVEAAPHMAADKIHGYTEDELTADHFLALRDAATEWLEEEEDNADGDRMVNDDEPVRRVRVVQATPSKNGGGSSVRMHGYTANGDSTTNI